MVRVGEGRTTMWVGFDKGVGVDRKRVIRVWIERG